VLLCVALGQGLGLYVVTVLACLVAVAQLAEVRKRGRLIRMGFVTGLLAAAGVLLIGLGERQYAPDQAGVVAAVVGFEAMAAGLATVFVGFFVLGALPFIERMFKVTTSMTLLELADMDHPLLRRLAQAAPGTFNHSLQVATLAEAGAEAIGGNSLLARVGAYYHDIGKIHKPAYFVENQTGGTNRHEKLSPAMSLLIIVAHVKDGVEMAREYGLIHFIESHHGTTLVEYFYHAAKRSRDERQQPEEIEFRYPGPRPQTKEAAVVMICDAAESACRALAEPTATRIEQLVQKLTAKRLLDGQFDECEITLNELRKVEEAVSKALASIYHGRVAYPGAKVERVETRRPQAELEERVAG
jgi:cyclic-di-AMP phosphodiesterase PgpH